jgi:RNA-directed DNA polymerase
LPFSEGKRDRAKRHGLAQTESGRDEATAPKNRLFPLAIKINFPLLTSNKKPMSYTVQKRRMIQKAKQLEQADTLAALARLLDTNPFQLLHFASNPVYQVFTIPKKGGGERLIETPAAPLKKCLHQLNDYLQALYYIHKTDAAYGFVAQPDKDPDPRNIVANARRHTGNGHLLNVDMKDFFHQVYTARMREIFQQQPFSLQDEAVHLLAQLVTYNGRLPMGAPTSPVCSNFAAIPLDNELLLYARQQSLTYTRFADDMSFSSTRQLPKTIIADITAMLTAHRFTANPKKIHQFGPKEVKMVTGLEVSDTVDITQAFMDVLMQDIERFRHIWQVQCGTGADKETEWVQQFKQAVEGKINFTGMVYGYSSERYQYAASRYETCYDVNEFIESRSWLDVPYQF